MSNIDQIDAIRSEPVSGCHKPDTADQDKACWLRPLSADQPFGACSPPIVLFKAERSANGKFIVSFADGCTVEVTEAQLRSEQRFRYHLRLKLGREFAAQRQFHWSCTLMRNEIIEWTDKAWEHERREDDLLDSYVQEWLERMAGVYDLGVLPLKRGIA
jgi:hypothetical protein